MWTRKENLFGWFMIKMWHKSSYKEEEWALCCCRWSRFNLDRTFNNCESSYETGWVEESDLLCFVLCKRTCVTFLQRKKSEWFTPTLPQKTHSWYIQFSHPPTQNKGLIYSQPLNGEVSCPWISARHVVTWFWCFLATKRDLYPYTTYTTCISVASYTSPRWQKALLRSISWDHLPGQWRSANW